MREAFQKAADRRAEKRLEALGKKHLKGFWEHVRVIGGQRDQDLLKVANEVFAEQRRKKVN